MIYLLLVMIVLGVVDLKEMKSKNLKSEKAVYIGLMFLAALLGVLYFSNPDQKSLSGIMFSIIGLEV